MALVWKNWLFKKKSLEKKVGLLENNWNWIFWIRWVLDEKLYFWKKKSCFSVSAKLVLQKNAYKTLKYQSFFRFFCPICQLSVSSDFWAQKCQKSGFHFFQVSGNPLKCIIYFQNIFSLLLLLSDFIKIWLYWL